MRQGATGRARNRECGAQVWNAGLLAPLAINVLFAGTEREIACKNPRSTQCPPICLAMPSAPPEVVVRPGSRRGAFQARPKGACRR